MPRMASSTSAPIAMARPPSVMVLIDRPSAWNTSAVTRMETGIAVSEMSVVRRLSRKANSTTATMIAPSRSASSTFSIEDSMNAACLKMISGAATPAGSDRDRSASATPISCVSRTVSAVGCFCTEMITAGLAL